MKTLRTTAARLHTWWVARTGGIGDDRGGVKEIIMIVGLAVLAITIVAAVTGAANRYLAVLNGMNP